MATNRFNVSVVFQIRNDDDHAIQFEFLQKGESRGKRWVPPGGTTEISFSKWIY